MEKIPSNQQNSSRHEQSPSPETIGNEALEGRTSELKLKLAEVNESELTPEQKGRFALIQERISKASQKFLNKVKWATLIVGTLGVANYEISHTELEIKDLPNNKREYKHHDERTTHLLNVLAGKEAFTQEDLRVEFDNLVTELASQDGFELSKATKDMTLDELDHVVFEIFSKNDPEAKRGEFKEEFLETFQRYSTPETSSEMQPSENIYEMVWQMEQEAGNPKIRFTAEDLHFIPLSGANGTKHYDPVSNTIFITPSDISPNSRYASFNNLAAELSHGKQFAERPVGTVLQYVADMAGVVKRGGLSMNNLKEEYEKLYHVPGSVEHEAHEIIEPYFLKKYQLFVKKQ